MTLANVALALTLAWDPYPALNTPPNAYPTRVRCYVTFGGLTTVWSELMVPAAPARMSGVCYPDSMIDSIPFVGRASFHVRGVNAAGESPNSNEWRLCSCVRRTEVPPVTGAATDGECVIYEWQGVESQCLNHAGWCSCSEGFCVDRSEFLGCVTAP